MVLQVTTANNIKVYTVSGGLGSRAIPDWLARQKKKQLKRDFGKCLYFIDYPLDLIPI
jgi:ribosome biogenesis protein ENP2